MGKCATRHVIVSRVRASIELPARLAPSVAAGHSRSARVKRLNQLVASHCFAAAAAAILLLLLCFVFIFLPEAPAAFSLYAITAVASVVP